LKPKKVFADFLLVLMVEQERTIHFFYLGVLINGDSTSEKEGFIAIGLNG